jgi:purine-binding chemotaxis protein CheW
MTAQAIAERSTYLTFGLGEEVFAIDVASVKEVLDLKDVTRIPQTPDYMKGVINLRGGVVPVIDMRLKYGLPISQSTVDSCIIVTEMELEGETVVVGALADSVREVLQISADQVEPPPKIGMKLESEFVQGIGKIGDDFVIILDVENTFSSDEASHIRAGAASSEPVTGDEEPKAGPVS